MNRHDAYLAELSRVTTQLLGLPEDDFAGRVDLRERQRELRQLAADAVSGDLDALRKREARLVERIEEAIGRRLGAASIGGGGEMGGGAVHPYEAAVLNMQIDEASGLQQLKSELAVVRQRIQALTQG